MQIIVNGQAQPLETPCSMQQLIEQMALGDQRIAVELNDEILPRSQYQKTLNDQDRIEIVQAIGGG